MPLGKGDRMISRVRLEAYGRNAAAVEESLTNAADSLDDNLFASKSGRGEQVIERSQEEPDGSVFAFRGRLILHPALPLADEDYVAGHSRAS
jgi:hypothetical protein